MNTDEIKDNNTNVTWPSYSQYLQYCSNLKITSKLTLEEWSDLGKTGKSEEKHAHGLGFMPGMPGTPARPSTRLPNISPLRKPPFLTPGGVSGEGISGMMGPDDIISKAYDLYEDLNDPTKSTPEKVKTTIKLIIEEVAANAAKKGGNINVESSESEMVSPPSVTGFSVKLPAVEVSYSPEIQNTLYSDYYRTADDRDANLYVTSLKWHMPSHDPQIEQYVQNILIPDLQTRANISVNFNVNAEQVFTFGKVSSYMTKIMQAMQTYYSYANIIAYCGKTGHTNTGMYRLRDMISAEDINLLSLLGERLNNLPIPPRLRELSFWLSNIYKSQSNCPNSPVLMIVPFNFELSGPTVDSDGDGYYDGIQPSIDSIINGLNPGVNNPAGVDVFNDKFINMMAKVCPGWLNTPMGSAEGVPLHDPHWMDVWSNSPCRMIDAADNADSYYVPSLTNGDDRGEEIKYVTHSSEISGINQALFSTQQRNTTNGWSGMLYTPESTSINRHPDGTFHYGITNRFLFATSSSTPNGVLYSYSGRNEKFNYSKSQSGWYNTPGSFDNGNITGNDTYMPVDCQPANGMNLSSNANPSYQATRWLMSFDEALTGPQSSKKFKPSQKDRRDKRRKSATEE